MNPDVIYACNLIQEGHLEQARQLLLSVCGSDPNDAIAHYRCASVHDMMGLEAEAVPYYEHAIQLGLYGADLSGAYIGLGSTYRCLGQYDKSISVFLRGTQQFPDNLAMKAFEAMTLHESGQHNLATALLLRCLVEKPGDQSIVDWRRALDHYSHHYAAQASESS